MAKRDVYHGGPSASTSSSFVVLCIDSDFCGGTEMSGVAVTQDEGPARRITTSLTVCTVSTSPISPCMLHLQWVALAGYVSRISIETKSCPGMKQVDAQTALYRVLRKPAPR